MIDLGLTYVEVRVFENYFQTLCLFHIFFKTAPLLVSLKEYVL